MRNQQTRAIDCFLIGHNQIPFEEYERSVKKMGLRSGAYRDLAVNMLQLNNRLYSAADIFNLFCSDPGLSISAIKPVETFNAGIAYLGTYLHRRGFRFDFINSFQDEKEYLREKLESGNILTAAILTTFYVTPLPVVEIVKFIKQHNPQVKIILGGPFVATRYRTCAPTEFDYLLNSLGADFYVNSSQGEAALVKIIGSLKHHLPFTNIDNIYYKSGDRLVSTPQVREANPLEENMVDWDLFAHRVGEFVNVRTCISCPFSCAFCGFPQHSGQFQTASVEAVEQELNQLARIKSLKGVSFVDDTFNIPVTRFKQLLRLMIKNDYAFKWSSFFRCQYADREMVELMQASGCENVLLGIESGNDQILENMNKSAAVEKYLEGIALLKQYGITTMGNFIIGFPGETEETVQDTGEFIKTAGLDFYRTQLWYYEPITPIAQQKEKYDLQGQSFEWSHLTLNAQKACDLIEQTILSLEEPVRYPQYYFDYDNIFQLPHKGLTLHQVKTFLKHFDNGVKERLKNPARKEVGFEVIRQIRASCGHPHDLEEFLGPVPSGNDAKTTEAEFDF
jgi:anaerobic magnesium-protoporphyrin IX monomethyl ester cyclase